jgi:DNA-binding response OmpR family regulator
MSTLLICPDLIFSTKIFSTAKALNVPVTAVRTLDALREKLATGQFTRLIVDLNATGVDAVEAVRVARTTSAPPHVIAFLSHVQTDLAMAAKEAGADQVLPRSAFSAKLPDLLAAP